MTIVKKSNLYRLAALSLAAMLLAGCSAGGDKKAEGTPTPSPEESETVRDYSKYNAYMDLANTMSDMEDYLGVYFDNVAYEKDFALLEGGDYAAIKDALQFYTSNTYIVEEALSYLEEEPAYDKADAAVRALGESPAKVMEALNAIASYTRFNDHEKDNLAKAPELHADLWAALEIYDTYYNVLMDAINEMAEEARKDDETNLLADGELVLYHSTCMIYSSQDIFSLIDDQIYAAYEKALNEGAEEFVYPTIDMTELSPLFDKFDQGYEGLNQAMESDEEREKVFSGKRGDAPEKLYMNKVDALYTKMGALAEVLLAGGDYLEAYDEASEALSSMIDAYNNII